MIICAIDPGTTQSAWVMRNELGVYTGDIIDNHALLLEIQNGHIHVADLLLIEEIESFGMAVGKSVFTTVHWAGRFHQAALHQHIAVDFVTRKDAKLTLCGNTRAKDSNIRQALLDRFGPDKETVIGKKKTPGPLYGFRSHMWSALAVLETYREMQQ